jgi:hypothetical protein
MLTLDGVDGFEDIHDLGHDEVDEDQVFGGA